MFGLINRRTQVISCVRRLIKPNIGDYIPCNVNGYNFLVE